MMAKIDSVKKKRQHPSFSFLLNRYTHVAMHSGPRSRMFDMANEPAIRKTEKKYIHITRVLAVGLILFLTGGVKA